MNDLIKEIQARLKLLETDRGIFYCKIDDPRYKPMSKKNSRPIRRAGGGKGRPFLGKSNELAQQERLLVSHFQRARASFGIRQPYKGPVHVMYHFHFGLELNRQFLLCDLTNLFEIVSDALQASNVIENDRFIMSVDGSRKIQSNKTFLEVFVLEFNEYEIKQHSRSRGKKTDGLP